MSEDELAIIRRVVWSFVRSSGGEFDEMLSEAVLVYLENQAKYNPARGKLSTFIWAVVSHHLISLIKKPRVQIAEVDMDAIPSYSTPERDIVRKEEWEELIARLSPEARMVCAAILGSTWTLPIEKPKQCRGVISKELRRSGMSHGAIWRTFAELKEILS